MKITQFEHEVSDDKVTLRRIETVILEPVEAKKFMSHARENTFGIIDLLIAEYFD